MYSCECCALSLIFYLTWIERPPLCYSNRWQLGLSRMVKIGDTTRHSWMGDDDMVINNTRHYLFPTFSANPLPNMSRSIVAKPGHSSKRSWGRTWRCSDLRVHKACGKSGVRFSSKHAWTSHENVRRKLHIHEAFEEFQPTTSCSCVYIRMSSFLLGAYLTAWL